MVKRNDVLSLARTANGATREGCQRSSFKEKKYLLATAGILVPSYSISFAGIFSLEITLTDFCFASGHPVKSVEEHARKS